MKSEYLGGETLEKETVVLFLWQENTAQKMSTNITHCCEMLFWGKCEQMPTHSRQGKRTEQCPDTIQLQFDEPMHFTVFTYKNMGEGWFTVEEMIQRQLSRSILDSIKEVLQLSTVWRLSQWVRDFSKETHLVSVSLKQFVWFLLRGI